MQNIIFDVVIEISKGSNLKYEINKKDGTVHLDRVLFGSDRYPHNYGYLPNTLDHDGDPLDVVMISNDPIPPKVIVRCKIVGALGMIDGGDRDTKLIGIIEVDPRFKHINQLSDIPQHWIDEIKDFFNSYKTLEKKTVELTGIMNIEDTMKIIQEGQELFKIAKK